MENNLSLIGLIPQNSFLFSLAILGAGAVVSHIGWTIYELLKKPKMIYEV
jgi:hypothetical protein